MSELGDPIAYSALQPGTPVMSSDGQQIGTVEHVLVVEEVDVFDGIVIKDADGIRFLDADRVGTIYSSQVQTNVPAAEVGDLPVPDQDAAVYTVDAGDDTGDSLSDRFGRLFGRGKWRRED